MTYCKICEKMLQFCRCKEAIKRIKAHPKDLEDGIKRTQIRLKRYLIAKRLLEEAPKP